MWKDCYWNCIDAWEGLTPTPGIEPGCPEGPGFQVQCNTIMRCGHNMIEGIRFLNLVE